MKKIKILYWITFTIVTIFSLSVLAEFIFFINMRSTFEIVYQETILGYYTHLIHCFLSIILITGLILILKGLSSIIKLKSFNPKSTINFKYSGLFIIIYGLAYLLFQVNFISSTEDQTILTSSVSSIFITIVGFGIYSFSEVLKTGELLKEENDLTV